MTATQAGREQLARGLLATWCALWLVVGIWTGHEVWRLADLGSTVADSGRALGSAGSALESLDALPLVGETTAALGREVRANGADVVAGARDAGSSVRRLAVLLGLTIALAPSAPVVVLVVAVRSGRLRVVRP